MAKEDKREDSVGKKKSTRFKYVKMEEVMDYCRFEMENCFMVVGGQVIKQIGGLPMGGMVSAVLAELDAMWKEQKMVKEFKRIGGGWKVVRFRDDIRVIVRGRHGSNLGKDIKAFLERIYGGSLEVAFEGFSHELVDFLDGNGFQCYSM